MKKTFIVALLSLPILAFSQVKKDTTYRAFRWEHMPMTNGGKTVLDTGIWVNSYTFPKYYTKLGFSKNIG
jgi:hypothetical protein